MIFASLKYSLKNFIRRKCCQLQSIHSVRQIIIKSSAKRLLCFTSSTTCPRFNSLWFFYFLWFFYSFPFLIFMSMSLLCFAPSILINSIQLRMNSFSCHFSDISVDSRAQLNYDWKMSEFWLYFKKITTIFNVVASII